MKRDLMRLTNTHIYLFPIFVIAYMYTDNVIKYITRPTIDSCFSFLPGETYRKLILGSNGLLDINIKYIIKTLQNLTLASIYSPPFCCSHISFDTSCCQLGEVNFQYGIWKFKNAPENQNPASVFFDMVFAQINSNITWKDTVEKIVYESLFQNQVPLVKIIPVSFLRS